MAALISSHLSSDTAGRGKTARDAAAVARAASAVARAAPHETEPLAFDAQYFAACYRASDDPWKIADGWYEKRKRALLLACLPQAHYHHAFEPGCGTGILTDELAKRCDHVLAGDIAASAIASAEARVSARAAAEITWRTMLLPRDWPEERFDLIVFSELAYYLSPDALADVSRRLAASLNDGGTFVCCHWRHPFTGAALVGNDLHDRIEALCGLPRLAQYDDPDFSLTVWTSNTHSPAQQQGLRP